MDDYEDHRCFNCDSRFCYGTGCRVPGNVYAPGWGWVTQEEATALEATGRTIYWNEVVE